MVGDEVVRRSVRKQKGSHNRNKNKICLLTYWGIDSHFADHYWHLLVHSTLRDMGRGRRDIVNRVPSLHSCPRGPTPSLGEGEGGTTPALWVPGDAHPHTHTHTNCSATVHTILITWERRERKGRGRGKEEGEEGKRVREG